MSIRNRRKVSKLALAAVAALAIGAAIAAAPGPSAPGEFYYYLNASGSVVGYRAIDCDGNKTGWGTATNRYESGWMLCEPSEI